MTGVQTCALPISRLAEYLVGVHDARARGIRIEVKADDIVLPIDSAMPLSIITTELVSNAFKHGFPDSRGGTVAIALERVGDFFEFRVSDDGIGFSAAKKAGVVPGKHKGIGMDLIEALAGQLGGTMERIDSQGAQTVMRFPVKPAE